jgi:hypothetical protein
MSYEILHWHYDKYNNSETSEWYKFLDGDREFYGVKFEHEGTSYESIYDENGSIISEKQVLNPKELPTRILEVLDYRIVKYKVKEYVLETEFVNKKEASKLYMVDARTKTGGQVILWFDGQLNILSGKRDPLAIR